MVHGPEKERFQELQQRELDNALSEGERIELTAMIQQMETDEAAYLGPATERLHSERDRLAAQNHALHEIIARKETLAARLRTVLDEDFGCSTYHQQ